MTDFETVREIGLDLPDVAPRVMVSLPSPGQVDLSVRIPVPARSRGRIEQKILGRFLSEHPDFFRNRAGELTSIVA